MIYTYIQCFLDLTVSVELMLCHLHLDVQCFVYFSAWVPYDTVYSYVGNKEKFLLTHLKPRQGYKEALEAIDDAVNAMSEEVMSRIVLWPIQID